MISQLVNWLVNWLVIGWLIDMHFSQTNVYSFSDKQVEALRTIDASIKALSLQRKDIENIQRLTFQLQLQLKMLMCR